jgi:hypothetical protein
MDDKSRPDEQATEPALARADEAIDDLEPDEEDAQSVKGGHVGGSDGGGRSPIG